MEARSRHKFMPEFILDTKDDHLTIVAFVSRVSHYEA
jgi:hypothetical protein